jgi:hypothetical protein
MTTANNITLRYRTSFLILMIISGLLMSVAGPLIVIAALVLFRPPGIFLGIILALSGLRLLRRYGRAFFRRQAAFQLDEQGLSYIAPDGYSIPWSSVLGLYEVRRGTRLAELYIYLTDNPASPLFVGDTDPRAGFFSGHKTESPNQLHLRLSHFDTAKMGDAAAAFRAFTPRQGAFPDSARILNGHLYPFNMMFFIVLMSLVLGGVSAGIAFSVASWGIGAMVFAGFQSLTLLVWAAGRFKRLSPGWATPRLIATNGMLYVPGAALGSVSFDDILNVEYRWSGLVLLFKTCQQAVQNFQYNVFGLSTVIMIKTRRHTSQEMENFFARGQVWNNGKSPDYKAARAQQKQEDADINRISRELKAKARQ